MPAGSIRNRILLVFFAALLVLLLVFLPSVNSLTQRLLRDNAVAFTRQMLFQVDNSINIYVKEMHNMSDYLVADPSITGALLRQGQSDEAAAGEILATVQGFRPDILSLAIFSEDGRYLSGRKDVRLNPNWDYREMDWYVDALSAHGQPVLSASHVSHTVADEYPWVVSLSRAIYREGRLLGVLLIDLNYAQIESICSHLTLANDGYVFILGKSKELVYHPLQQLIYSGLKSEPLDRIPSDGSYYEESGGQRIFLGLDSPASGWTLVGVVNTRNFFPVQPLLWMAFSVLLLFFFGVYVLVNITLRYNLHQPLKELSSSIRAFQSGQFGTRADIHVNNELDLVGESFNTMTERIETLMRDSRRIAEEKRRSELQTLQAQIRPHFLYNTLESIIWMAELGDKESVISMTSSLSRLLRASNADIGQLISLRQEMDYANHYLIIQKMRYREKLGYRLNCPDALMPARMLSLCIQPLIENAIYHGLKPLKEGGLIIVDVWALDDELILRVSDNGVGFDLSDDAQQKGFLPWPSQTSEGGLGLANVQERLSLYFGPGFGLSVISRGKSFSMRSNESFTRILASAPALPFTGGTSILLHLPLLMDQQL